VVDQMPAGLQKSLFVSQIAEGLGVAEAEVKGHLSRDVRPARPARREDPLAAKPPELDPAEEMFAALLVADPLLRSSTEARFVDEIHSLDVRVLLSSEQPEQGLSALPSEVGRAIERRLAEIAATLCTPEHRRRALFDASRSLRLSRVEERLKEKTLEIREAEHGAAGDDDIGRLQAEFSQLSELRTRLKSRAPGGETGRGTTPLGGAP
jgi:hypothetical protein